MRQRESGIIHLIPLILVAVVIVVIAAGAFYFSQNSQTPLVTKQDEITEDENEMPARQELETESTVGGSDWKTYRVEEVGLAFKLPPTINDSKKFEEIHRQGDSGTYLCATFGASELFVGCHNDMFALGTTSQDFSAAREAFFLDYRGYRVANGNYYARFLGNNEAEIPPELVKEITTSQGKTILRITGKSQTEGEYRGSIAGTPGDGKVGALVNFNGNPEFDGLAIYMTLGDGRTIDLFDQILSTFEFTK